MERGDALIIPPPGVGKVPGEGEKGVVGRCICSKIVQAHHVAFGRGGGVWKRLVVVCSKKKSLPCLSWRA